MTKSIRSRSCLSQLPRDAIRCECLFQILTEVGSVFLVFLAVLTFAPFAHAQSALPIDLPAVTLTTNSNSVTTLIALDGLPSRPLLVVEVTPDALHPDLVLVVQVDNFVPDPGDPIRTSCDEPGATEWSASGNGTVILEADLYACLTQVGQWAGTVAEVTVTAPFLGFLSASPANVAIEIRAETSVVTGTTTEQVFGSRILTAIADGGTVFYEDAPTFSNGAGVHLWAGVSTEFDPSFASFSRNSLFRFSSLNEGLPSNADITSAEIELTALGVVGGGGAVDLFAIAQGAFWFEGIAQGPGDEFFGAQSFSSLAANYVNRFDSTPWLLPGGDTTTASPLASRVITSSGTHVFAGAALAGAVQDVLDFGDFGDGFKLVGPFDPFDDTAVRFASDDFPDPAMRPTIRVEFDQPEPFSAGALDTDLVEFVNEGDNFRWIYDTDDDGVLLTEIGGICTDTGYLDGDFNVPYEYTYAGTPGYTGVDCCTWQIEGVEGTVGTGQALFFHNLDASDPANFPPDTDEDGIRDLCDNCPYTANGPLLGSCVDINGFSTGATCRSNLECAGGLSCDLSQLEDDGAAPGLACPEPGFGFGAMLGFLGLAALRPRGQGPSGRGIRGAAMRSGESN